MTWAIRPATTADARWIAPRMSPADAAEVWAAHHRTPLEALQASMNLSIEAWTWHIDGEPVCMFGMAAASLLGDWANPWMLGTPMVKRHRYAFLRNYRPYLDRMFEYFPTLITYVDARHGVCLKWLLYSGFTIFKPEPYGVDQRLFCRVQIVRA